MREMVNAKQTQVHPGNPAGVAAEALFNARSRYLAESSPCRISNPWLNSRFEANALIEQGFEPASDRLVLGNALLKSEREHS